MVGDLDGDDLAVADRARTQAAPHITQEIESQQPHRAGAHRHGGGFVNAAAWSPATCNYSISDHHLTCSDGAGQFLDTTDVFSGKGKYINDPLYQCLSDRGPIPSGMYAISEPFTWPTNGTPNAMNLSPMISHMCGDIWTGTVGRSSMALHQGVVSNGCIVFNNPAELASIAARAGGILMVRSGPLNGT